MGKTEKFGQSKPAEELYSNSNISKKEDFGQKINNEVKVNLPEIDPNKAEKKTIEKKFNQKGVPEGYTRTSLIFPIDHLRRLKSIAVFRDTSVTNIIMQLTEQYVKDYENK